MSTVVLARKYRSRNFKEMVGQGHVVQALSNALSSQRLHHAYLFTGTRGIGKTTVSRILAKALNCVGPDGTGNVTPEPCGVCQACRDIDAGRFVDYTELDAASNRGVEEVQQLLEQALYKPVVGRYKVFMIDEVHMLSNTAFNAMLKTLEEPPEYLKFVLATTDPQKVPVTVLSRCLQFNLRPMSADTIEAHLRQVLASENISAQDAALRAIGKAARGSMRDALSLTDQAIAYGAGELRADAVRQMLGSTHEAEIHALIAAVANADGAAVFGAVEALRTAGRSAISALEALVEALQRMAFMQAAGVQPTEDDAALVQLANAMPADELQLLYSLCLNGRGELQLAPDEHAGLAMLLLRLLAFKPGGAANKPIVLVAAPRSSAQEVPSGGAAVAEKKPEPALQPAPEPAEPVKTPDFEAFDPGVTESIDFVAAKMEATEVPAEALGEFWVRTVAQLNAPGTLAALARQLADQSQLLSTGDVWRLRCPNSSLVQGQAAERLIAAIKTMGFTQQVAFEVGEANDTPAQRTAAALRAATAQAQAAMDADPYVQQLMREFGATVVPGSFKLQSAPQPQINP